MTINPLLWASGHPIGSDFPYPRPSKEKKMATTMKSKGGGGRGKSPKRSKPKMKGSVALRVPANKPGSPTAADLKQGATAGHNAASRAKIVREVCKEVEALELKRDAISADIRAIKNTKIKGALGMKLADFDAALRMAKLDPEARAEMLDTIEETFEALGVSKGETMDWLTNTKDADRKNIADQEEHDKKVEAEGEQAGLDGKFPMANPHETGTSDYGLWESGRLRGHAKATQANMPKGPKAVTTAETGNA